MYGLSIKELRQMTRAGDERALARLALAFRLGRGIRLSPKDVDDIIQMDQALHQRLFNELDRQAGVTEER